MARGIRLYPSWSMRSKVSGSRISTDAVLHVHAVDDAAVQVNLPPRLVVECVVESVPLTYHFLICFQSSTGSSISDNGAQLRTVIT